MKVIKNDQPLFIGWKYDNPVLESLIVNKIPKEGIEKITLEEARKLKTNKLLEYLEINHVPEPETTWCIVRNESKETVAEVSVKKHKHDAFDKEKARRFSLTKVLNNNFFGDNNREFRKQVWESYLTRNKNN